MTARLTTLPTLRPGSTIAVRRPCLPVFFSCCSLVLIAGSAAAQETKVEVAQEYFEAFKGKLQNDQDFAPMDRKADECVKIEADGLRITLPVGFPGRAGLVSNFGVSGDFEITVNYEILKEPEAADAGAQTRFAVSVTLDKPSSRQDQAALNYRVVPTAGSQFFAWLSLKNQATGQPEPQMQSFPIKTKTGRLRLVRREADLSFYGAAGPDQDFALLCTIPFGVEDVRSVSLVGATGGPRAALDVRITDLRIRAAAFPRPGPLPAAPSPPGLIIPEKVYAQEYYQSLKTRAQSIPGLEIIGPGKEQHVRFEENGLRITLPSGWNGERPSTGLRTSFGVKGDFEITLSFEVLHKPKQEDAGVSGGTRLNLGIIKKTPGSESTTVARTVSVKSGDVFYAWSVPFLNSATGRRTALNQALPTNATTGRLRLVRAGSDLFYGVSEGAQGDFKFFAKNPFGAEDLQQVRIIAATGGNKASLDARLADFRIRADEIPNMPAAHLVEADPGPPKGRLAAILFGGSTAILLLTLVFWRHFRERSRTD